MRRHNAREGSRQGEAHYRTVISAIVLVGPAGQAYCAFVLLETPKSLSLEVRLNRLAQENARLGLWLLRALEDLSASKAAVERSAQWRVDQQRSLPQTIVAGVESVTQRQST